MDITLRIYAEHDLDLFYIYVSGVCMSRFAKDVLQAYASGTEIKYAAPLADKNVLADLKGRISNSLIDAEDECRKKGSSTVNIGVKQLRVIMDGNNFHYYDGVREITRKEIRKILSQKNQTCRVKVSIEDEKSIKLLSMIRSRKRNLFIKTLMRNALGRQNLSPFFSLESDGIIEVLDIENDINQALLDNGLMPLPRGRKKTLHELIHTVMEKTEVPAPVVKEELLVNEQDKQVITYYQEKNEPVSENGEDEKIEPETGKDDEMFTLLASITGDY